MIQFRHEIFKTISIDNQNKIKQSLNITKEVPKSSIVFNKKSTWDTKFKLICEKYIINDSDYQVNISYDNRDEVVRTVKLK